MSDRFFTSALVASLLSLVAMSLGCDRSPVGPTAPTAPASPVTPAVPAVAAVPAAIRAEDVSLTASPSQVTSGDQVTLRWVAPNGRGCVGGGDWIALYRVGDPDSTGAANGHSDLWFEHLCGATSGTSTLGAPSQPGQYEFRYLTGSQSTAVARSNPVTVSASASPAPLVPTLSIDAGTASSRQIDETFWYTGRGYTPGGTVTRYVTPAVNGSTVLAPTLTADASGDLYWTFTPRCGNPGNPKGTFTVYIVDDATGRRSNTVTQTVTSSALCP